MVLTPWGDSSSLRTRKLRPGPGVPRREVVRNQRERIYGAMVACVAEKGYEETRVADLLEVSGLSSRTFYNLFADKRACFVATLEAMIGGAVQVTAGASGPGDEEQDWEVLARQADDAFAQLIVLQPAAAKMILVEAPAAGEEVLARLEVAIAGFEALAREMLSRSPERRDIPAQMITAYIGAMREIARNRLLQGREAEMPGVVEEMWELIGSFRAPPVPLRPAGRMPAPRAEPTEAHDHAERAIRAFAIVVAEKGFAATTVDDVVRRASMSATTFYAHFEGKRDLMTAAIDSAAAQMLAAVQPAVRRAPDWPRSIRAGFAALFSFLASRPALARLIIVEVHAGGASAMRRRAENLQPLEELLEKGHQHSPEAPAITVEAVAGVVYTLSYRQIREGGPESLPGLAPVCTYIALAPFVGAEEAASTANESGMSKTGSRLRQTGERTRKEGATS
ncbi:MAG: TetR/AcrR family transcriptional regulator [Solirubrobacterales bacterium]